MSTTSSLSERPTNDLLTKLESIDLYVCRAGSAFWPVCNFNACPQSSLVRSLIWSRLFTRERARGRRAPSGAAAGGESSAREAAHTSVNTPIDTQIRRRHTRLPSRRRHWPTVSPILSAKKVMPCCLTGSAYSSLIAPHVAPSATSAKTVWSCDQWRASHPPTGQREGSICAV